ncbi:expressed unknown protein [Seminavis robusta]|uniref:Uncharacterized protein n=1 Tax=Seminavis robusta TaxID=568900 RepID=A0A9N8D986_9STRA|nr:expressed unknown protein [Seminavis robusta]|eukprot:Sro3_g002400.1 n/a (267) ;mRNA; r:140799-141677
MDRNSYRNMGHHHIKRSPDSLFCNRLPMGLTNSPDILQECMMGIMDSLEYARIYIDDYVSPPGADIYHSDLASRAPLYNLWSTLCHRNLDFVYKSPASVVNFLTLTRPYFLTQVDVYAHIQGQKDAIKAANTDKSQAAQAKEAFTDNLAAKWEAEYVAMEQETQQLDLEDANLTAASKMELEIFKAGKMEFLGLLGARIDNPALLPSTVKRWLSGTCELLLGLKRLLIRLKISCVKPQVLLQWTQAPFRRLENEMGLDLSTPCGHW